MAVSRLAELFAGPEPSLDRVMAAIAAGIDEGAPDEATVVGQLDRLAEGCPTLGDDAGDDVETVIDHVYRRLGFGADTVDYYSPDNSLIHRVLERRRGIPLSLAIVVSEIGRRHNVDLRPVGLPGHVLLGHGPQPEVWFDPFAAGARLAVDDCRQLFAQFHPIEAFRPGMLAPIPAQTVALRTLNNLRGAYLRLGQPSSAIPVLQLVLALPDAGPANFADLAELLIITGRHDQAADTLERLAELDPAQAEQHRRRVHGLRAHQN